MNNDIDHAEADGPTVLSAVRGRSRLVAGVGLLGLLLGAFAAVLMVPPREARADVYLNDPTEIDPAYPIRPVGGDFARFVGVQAQVMRSVDVLTAAGQAVGKSLDELRDVTTTSTGGGDQFVILRVSTGSGSDAEEIRAAILDAYGTYRSSLLHAQLAELSPDDAQINRLNVYSDGIASTELTLAGGNSLLRLLQYAILGASVAIGGLLSCLWLLEVLNPKTRAANDLEGRHGLSLLGVIRGGDDAASGLEAASLAVLHRVRQHAQNNTDNAVVLIPANAASQDPNLAMSLASQAGRAGLGVLLLDAATHVYGDRQLPASLASAPVRPDGLVLVGQNFLLWPMSQARSREFGARQREEAIQSWFGQFGGSTDLRLVDSPCPTVDYSALRFSAVASAAVIVVSPGTKQHDVVELVDMLRRVGIEPLGYLYQREKISTAALHRSLEHAPQPTISAPELLGARAT